MLYSAVKDTKGVSIASGRPVEGDAFIPCSCHSCYNRELRILLYKPTNKKMSWVLRPLPHVSVLGSALLL